MTELKQDPLVELMEEFEHALTAEPQEHEAVWLSRVRQSLRALQDALRRHPTPDDKEMLHAAEPQQREISPGLARKVRVLRKDQKEILKDAVALSAAIERGAPTGEGASAFRERGLALLKDLRELCESQNRVAMDTLMRDTGVGE